MQLEPTPRRIFLYCARAWKGGGWVGGGEGPISHGLAVLANRVNNWL